MCVAVLADFGMSPTAAGGSESFAQDHSQLASVRLTVPMSVRRAVRNGAPALDQVMVACSRFQSYWTSSPSCSMSCSWRAAAWVVACWTMRSHSW